MGKLKEKLDNMVQKGKEAVKGGINSACRAYYDHEADIRNWAPIIAAVGAVAVKKGLKTHKKNEEIRERECSHYDPRNHQWYDSRRPLTSKEKLKLDQMYESGISKGEALRRMKLLKW